MPTEFTHMFVSAAFGGVYAGKTVPKRFWFLTAVCSVLPDVDVVGYYWGIRYSSMFGHRGFFHSLTFAAVVGMLVTAFAFPALARFSRQWWSMTAFFFLVTASHGVLDAMTDKGMGVGFFIPFDNTRYFMPWRPIFASPMRVSRFFSRTGCDVLTTEILWIWIPVGLGAALIGWLRKRQHGS